jgi:hypothetical protein
MLSKEGHSRASALVSKPRASDSGPRFSAVGHGAPVLKRGELDADPSRLRENLDELAELLHGSGPRARRRIPQVFGALVARWQDRLEGPISVVIEFLPGAVRMSLRSPQGMLPPAASAQLLSPIILDLIDSYGIDPGAGEDVWFEILDDEPAGRTVSQTEYRCAPKVPRRRAASTL